MALVLHIVCDGCGTAQPGSKYPDSWPAYATTDRSEPRRFCSDECARSDLAGADRRAARLKELGLTEAEVRLLEHLATGDSIKGIAQSTGQSLSTVKNNTCDLYFTLGAHDRLGALLLAHALGVIDLDAAATAFLRAQRTRPKTAA